MSEHLLKVPIEIINQLRVEMERVEEKARDAKQEDLLEYVAGMWFAADKVLAAAGHPWRICHECFEWFELGARKWPGHTWCGCKPPSVDSEDEETDG